jgi:hypothetical protein
MLNLSIRENEQEPEQKRAVVNLVLGSFKRLLFLAAVTERALVNDAFSGDTFGAEMFPAGAAESSMLVTDGYSAFFAYRLSGFVAKIALTGLVPDYFTRCCLENFPIGTA